MNSNYTGCGNKYSNYRVSPVSYRIEYHTLLFSIYRGDRIHAFFSNSRGFLRGSTV